MAVAFTDSVNDHTPNTGDTITYTLSGAPAFTTSTEVTVTDQLGAGLSFVSAAPSVGTYDSATGVWDLGTLSDSSQATLTLKAKVNAGTEGQTIANNPTVEYVQTSCTKSSAITGVSITVQGAGTPTSTPSYADLAVQKTADVATTTEGNVIHYTVTVTDNGPATSTGVVATDTLPSGLTFQHATASTGTYSSSTGAWTIGTLVPNASATLEIAAKVNKNTAGHTITNTAIATESASTTDSNLSNNRSSVSVFVVKPNCPTSTPSSTVGYSISKTVDDGSPHAGDTVHYTVVVGNIGTVVSTGTVATDTLPSGLTLVSATTSQGAYASSTGAWTIGTLAPNATATLSVAALVNASDTVGQAITNTATIASDTASVTITVQGNGGGCGSSCPVNADISVKKTADVTSTVEGGTINYTITATDLGPATSTDVVATDTLPSGLTLVSATPSVGTYSTSTGAWMIGTLAANATATLQIAATANAGTASSTIVNTATIGESPSETDTNTSNNSSSVSVFVAPNGGGCGSSCPVDADIAIKKTVDDATPNPGDTVHYLLTVTDNGPATSTFVVAHDQLPPTTALSFLDATTSQGSYNLSTGDWTVGTVAPDATATLELAAVVGADQAGKTITNTASVSQLASLVDPDLSNNTSSVTLDVQGGGGGCGSNCPVNADIAIAKSVDNANPAAGNTVTYTITATDNGPATSTDVVATDTLPGGLTFVSASTSAGTYSTSTGTWTIGTLTPSSTATLTIAATVNSGTAGQTITNTATIGESSSETDTDTSNNTASATLTVKGGGCTSNCGGGGGGSVPTAEIGIVKTVDNANPAPGAVIHYTLTVSATGPSPSIGVVASDTLPAGVTFSSASSSLGSYDTATGIWTIGNMNVGQSATLVITATVNSTDPAGETITNTGTVHESPAVNDQNSVNNTSSVTVTVAGGGGGGGGTVTVPGGGGGTVVGTSTPPGLVLGTSTSCGLYLDEYIHPIRKYLNTPSEVVKLQSFLNANLGTTLPLTGYYGPLTEAAVNQFQVKYHTEVLLPWVPLGLPTEYTPTSYVYQTTWRWINLIECPSLNLPMPVLKVDDFATSYTYAF